MRIIIVEDEVKIRTAMGRLIEDVTGHKVIGEAKNGKEGLELFFKYRPDLIITDIRMPEMDGLEMLKALHEKGIPFHAVILSGYAEFDYARQAMALGVNDYLLKPVSVEDVKELLERLDQKLT
ncbi:MAG: response regulator, partial [Lacrimispora sp.]